ncbi:MAG: hypothetical protein B7Z75_13710 [Acidocella sp. 20-57-95]|nr:MAG: hypothetical protein B7Z75_13710 [Acidocella sp. 20-57-95]
MAQRKKVFLLLFLQKKKRFLRLLNLRPGGQICLARRVAVHHLPGEVFCRANAATGGRMM